MPHVKLESAFPSAFGVPWTLLSTNAALGVQRETVVRDGEESVYLGMEGLSMVDGFVEAQGFRSHAPIRALGQD
ncbi:MAG: hypothetical protein ACK5YW_08380 [Betaproteobacteria bacterium]|nr:hypothetical protein [Rhodocyclaceae bacterium]MCA3141415.1 hypothetical protein [Rhodocyclaceae bacterium]MCA3145746.1 hypothetical protein [Rhodocyclaceae bacterium]MCE2897984.1 hypothetical protein [Betaproteobacteria bacterium]